MIQRISFIVLFIGMLCFFSYLIIEDNKKEKQEEVKTNHRQLLFDSSLKQYDIWDSYQRLSMRYYDSMMALVDLKQIPIITNHKKWNYFKECRDSALSKAKVASQLRDDYMRKWEQYK